MRDDILARIRGARPSERPYPTAELPWADGPTSNAEPASRADLIDRFARNAQTNGSRVVRVPPGESVASTLAAIGRPEGPAVAHGLSHALDALRRYEGWADLAALDRGLSSADLAAIGLAVLRSSLAVAENGAVWLTEREMGVRALPYACEHLWVLVPRAAIVGDMHAAYAKTGPAPDFGCFIAGPSKTADIEQSLVIGAQGARSLTLVVEG